MLLCIEKRERGDLNHLVRYKKKSEAKKKLAYVEEKKISHV